MAGYVVGAAREFSLGRVLSRAFETIGANPVTILVVALIFGAVPKMLFDLASQRMTAMTMRDEVALAVALTQLASLFVRIVVSVLVQGAVTRVTVAHSLSERASLGDNLATASRLLLPLLALAVVNGLGVFAGLLVAIVPGIILWVMWIVAAPVLVAENAGIFASLKRSAQLTKGMRWQVFGLELAVIVFGLIIGGVIGAIGIIVGFHGTDVATLGTAVIVIGALATTLAGALSATIQASLYVELRDWKEGPVGDRLADIFA